ncbi:tetratricopeptide repeat protein [Lichenicoccus roseus]|uniref:Tetratricopeptide repeat protein n=1 Tax=Lichenicoccus roseus TaxID=2683649 RepID=A0A5R9J863_9PROT|nr:tetratricopeptide repeat protein [Lichenicoccus roseus]
MTSFRASIPIRCVSWYCCLLAGCATLPASSQVDHDLKVADIELASGAPDAALRIMQDLAARRPGDARVTLRMGEADAALGHPQAAEASFRRVLATAPGNVPAGLGLARLQLASDPAGALAGLQGLAKAGPRDARILTDLGVALDLLGRAAEAQAAYHAALDVDPALLSAQADLGLSLAISGHPSAALRLLGPLARSADAGSRVRQDYALAETLAGHQEQAASVLRIDMPATQVASVVNAFESLRDAPR